MRQKCLPFIKQPSISESSSSHPHVAEGFSPGSVESFAKIDRKEKQRIFNEWGDQILKPMKTWSQSLEEGPMKDHGQKPQLLHSFTKVFGLSVFGLGG